MGSHSLARFSNCYLVQHSILSIFCLVSTLKSAHFPPNLRPPHWKIKPTFKAQAAKTIEGVTQELRLAWSHSLFDESPLHFWLPSYCFLNKPNNWCQYTILRYHRMKSEINFWRTSKNWMSEALFDQPSCPSYSPMTFHVMGLWPRHSNSLWNQHGDINAVYGIVWIYREDSGGTDCEGQVLG